MHQGQDTLNYFRQSNKTFLVLQVFNTITISLLLGYNHAVATNSQIMMRIPKHILKKGGRMTKTEQTFYTYGNCWNKLFSYQKSLRSIDDNLEL